MQMSSLVGIVIACATTSVAVYTSSTQPPSPHTTMLNEAQPSITVSGCVPRNDAGIYEFRFRPVTHDRETETTYSPTETSRHLSVGRIKIVGGFLPSANIAAQAGALDSTHSAMAASGGTAGTGNVRQPELRVDSVRPPRGSCG